MNEETENLFKKYGKTIYISESDKRWAIVIMPDEIRIDNYHKETHLHTELRGIHIPTKYKEMESVGLIVVSHLSKNKGIKIKKLMEELI